MLLCDFVANCSMPNESKCLGNNSVKSALGSQWGTDRLAGGSVGSFRPITAVPCYCISFLEPATSFNLGDEPLRLKLQQLLKNTQAGQLDRLFPLCYLYSTIDATREERD